MNKTQLKSLIERKLKEIDLYSIEAVNLLLGTAAQESQMGHYIRQLFHGPALGIFQMEPATFSDHLTYLNRNPRLKEKVLKAAGVTELTAEQLEWNIALAICMARVHYYRKPALLPSTIEEMAAYWKKHYNTYLGKGTEEEFIVNYKKYVL